MDWEIYEQAQNDCKQADGEIIGYDNPYKQGTEKYKSYRRGWNQYWNEKWKKQVSEEFKKNS